MIPAIGRRWVMIAMFFFFVRRRKPRYRQLDLSPPNLPQNAMRGTAWIARPCHNQPGRRTTFSPLLASIASLSLTDTEASLVCSVIRRVEFRNHDVPFGDGLGACLPTSRETSKTTRTQQQSRIRAIGPAERDSDTLDGVVEVKRLGDSKRMLSVSGSFPFKSSVQTRLEKCLGVRPVENLSRRTGRSSSSSSVIRSASDFIGAPKDLSAAYFEPTNETRIRRLLSCRSRAAHGDTPRP